MDAGQGMGKFKEKKEILICFNAGTIRLVDHKGCSGRKRVRWLPIHPILADALCWWEEERPREVDNVFMQLENDVSMGKPFTEHNKLMPRLCARWCEAIWLSCHTA